MARSSTIWLVMDSEDNPVPVAGFTVKHELVKWLEDLNDISMLRVFRMPDNPTGYSARYGRNGRNPVRVPLEELIEEE